MTMTDLRNSVCNEIARRAPHYTPEWRYNSECPDAGTALAMLWADMHTGTLARFEQLDDNFRRALLDAIGSEPQPAVAAEGYLAFTVRTDAGDFVVPKGSVVAAPSDPDATLVTQYDLAASPMKIADIYSVVPSQDTVERLDSLENIALTRPAPEMAHGWTFTHDFAFNISRAAALRLIPDVSDSGLGMLAASDWAYRSAGVWRGFSVIRDGRSLLCVFPKDGIGCDAVRVNVSRNEVLHSLIAKPFGKDMPPDALYADNSQAQNGFYPFGQRFIPGVCAYFSNADALTKPGAKVTLTFTLIFENFEIEGYAETQIYMRRIMRASDFKPPETYTVLAAETKWEYYNGVGWAALDVDTHTGLFDGETGGQIQITFNGPEDMRFTVVGAHELPFIRVRLIGVHNLYRQRGHYKAPYISDICFGYHYDTGVPITRVTVEEHLDVFEKKLPAPLAAPPDGPAALYFASDTVFTRGTVLFHLRPGGAGAGIRWEYLSASGWTPLGVRDETAGLSKTGILSYQTDSPAVRARLWGRMAYWFRLVLDYNGMPDRFLYGLYENAVRAVAGTPGEASVLPAGAFTTVITPLAGVVSARNPIAVAGGADMENERHLIARLSAALSHGGSAVSCADYEALALEASLLVRRVRYYSHTDEHGAVNYGQACLVVLARDMEGVGFETLRDVLLAYITPRRALGAEKLSVIPPQYVVVNVSSGILIERYGEALGIKNGIDQALADLLAPENWEIGQLPAPGQIMAVIRELPGVVRIAKCDVSYVMPTGICVDYTRAEREAFILPVNGRHTYAFNSKEF